MYTVDGVADILSRCDDHREGQEDHRGDAPGVHGDHDDDLNGDDDQEGQDRNHQNGQTNITQHILFPQEKSLFLPLFGK